MKAKHLLFLVLLIIVAVSGCRKMNFSPKWDVELLIPIAQSRLSLDQLLTENELRVNSANDYEVFYEGDIFNFSLDSLFTIPDTSILKVNQGTFIPITIAPGQTWISDTNNNRFQIKDVSLLEAELAGGMLIFEISSNITEAVEMLYEVPGAFKDGQVLRLSKTIPAAASQNSPVVLRDSINLSGYTLDLRGKDRNTANTVFFFFTARLSPSANPVAISSLQYVNLRTTYKSLLPYFGRGYFRQQLISENGSVDDFEVFQNLPAGKIDIEDIALDFTIKNSVGVDVRAQIKDLVAVNDATGASARLSGPGKEQALNLNRATQQSGNVPPVFSQVQKHLINSQNSNLDQLVEVLPNRVNYALDLEINPLGSVSGGNDFIYLNTGIDIRLNARIPLHFSAENLVFMDTLDLVLDSADKDLGTDPVYGGSLFLKTQNTFPLNIRPMLYFMNAQQQISDSLKSEEFVRAHFDDSPFDFTENILEFQLSEEQVDALYDYPFLVLKLEIETAAKKTIRLRPGQYVHTTLSADFKYLMNPSVF